MAEGVKQITDPSQIDRVIEQLFLKGKVTLSIQGQTPLPVQIHSYANRLLDIQLQPLPPQAERRLLRLPGAQHVMFLECKFIERKADHEFLQPVRLHLQQKDRQAERADLKDKGLLYVSGLVVLSSFIDQLSSISHKRDAIVHAFSEKLKQRFDVAKIELRRSFRMDPRMRLMDGLGKPIFAPDRVDQEKWQLTARASFSDIFVSFEEYSTLEQYGGVGPSIVSEVCEPLYYRRLFLYGYIMVQSSMPLDLEDFRFVERFARSLEKELEGQGLLPVNLEKSPVVDLNLNGIGIMHPHNPVVMRDFHPGEDVIFDLFFPRFPTMAFAGVIANARAFEKAHRIGIQFKDLKADQISRLEATLRDLQRAQAKSEE